MNDKKKDLTGRCYSYKLNYMYVPNNITSKHSKFSFNSHNKLINWVLLVCTFYKWRNLDTKR